MAPTCGVCQERESKYKCPTCALRYCSLICYKSHNQTHEHGTSAMNNPAAQPVKDRPGTKQRVPKVDFTGFENDPELKRLLSRYPLLGVQLQAIYALTLEPGPSDARSWNRDPLPSFERPARGTHSRGRGRGFRGGRLGAVRGGRDVVVPEGRQWGQWTRAKGDREALDVIKKMRSSEGSEEEIGEGMKEFIQLCQIKFGP